MEITKEARDKIYAKMQAELDRQYLAEIITQSEARGIMSKDENITESNPSPRVGTLETVMVTGAIPVCGTVYHVRDNGWACVETDTGRVASGPSTHDWACMSQSERDSI